MFDADVMAALLPPGWDAEDEATLICPCGHVIETDGHCPDGCPSPLRAQGLI